VKACLTALRTRWTQTWRDPAWRTAVVVFLVLRLVLSVWMWGVRQIYAHPTPPDPDLRPYVGVAVEPNPWLEVWQRWDTTHYQAIAERGYTSFGLALFVPPLYPLLMRGVGGVTGGDTLLAGILVSNVFYLLGLVAFYRLVFREGQNRPAAQRAVIYLASFPTAFFFLAAYTEALYLFAVVLMFEALRAERWGWAGIGGGLASLSRLPGVLAVAPLVYVAWTDWRTGRKVRPGVWGAISLTLLGAAIFPLYVWLGMGLPPWTPLLIQNIRNSGGLAWPGANLLAAARQALSGQFVLTDVIDLTFFITFIVGAVPVWRKLPRIYSVYYLAVLALYLTRIAGSQPLLGIARYVLALFPLFMVWGPWGQNAWVNRLVLYTSWAGLLFLSGQFAIWGWVG
jgi:hypothetical protein